MQTDQRRWHLGKEIPVSVILMLLIQTGAVLIWGSRLTAEVTTNTSETMLLRVKVEEIRTAVNSQTLPAINAAKISELEKNQAVIREELKEIRGEIARFHRQGR